MIVGGLNYFPIGITNLKLLKEYFFNTYKIISLQSDDSWPLSIGIYNKQKSTGVTKGLRSTKHYHLKLGT